MTYPQAETLSLHRRDFLHAQALSGNKGKEESAVQTLMSEFSVTLDVSVVT